MTRGLLAAAFVCALVSAALAFEVITASDEQWGDPVGWLAFAFGFYVLAALIPDRGR